MTPEQRQRAGRAVADRIAEMAATLTTVARAADISPKTLRAVIQGQRWTTDAVQSRLEAVLRWREGEIAARAIRGGTNGGLAALTDAELAAELLRRVNDRDRRESQLRSTDTRRGASRL